MRIPEWVRRPVAAVLLIWMSACATAGGWKEVAVTPLPTKQTRYAGDVRIATTSGTVYALRGLWIGPDSLGGWLVEPAGTERRFALGEVTKLEVRGASGQARPAGVEGDGDQKVIMILLGALFVANVAAAIIIGDLGLSGPCCR